MVEKITTWILIANSSAAKLYSAFRLGGEMKLVKAYQHPESREPVHDLVTDKSGHYEGNYFHQVTLEQPDSLKEVEAQKFAREICEDLALACNKHEFDRLVVIAPPQFHGLLNKLHTNQVRGKITLDIQKDYTKIPEKELKEEYLSKL